MMTYDVPHNYIPDTRQTWQTWPADPADRADPADPENLLTLKLKGSMVLRFCFKFKGSPLKLEGSPLMKGSRVLGL